MSGLSWNLQASRDAVVHVKSQLPLGAGNVMEDFVASKGQSYTCATKLRGSYPGQISHGRQTDAWIKYVAKAATDAGCGNCAEQCAVAIEFLLEYGGIESLDYMGFDPSRGFDHQFLVIGRERGSQVTKVSTWGLNAVICDPWQGQAARRAYCACEAWHKMVFLPAGEHTLMSLVRWDA